eukprot:Polyplicarium_translucidae@DN3266_c0_g1_i6.p1
MVPLMTERNLLRILGLSGRMHAVRGLCCFQTPRCPKTATENNGRLTAIHPHSDTAQSRLWGPHKNFNRRARGGGRPRAAGGATGSDEPRSRAPRPRGSCPARRRSTDVDPGLCPVVVSSPSQPALRPSAGGACGRPLPLQSLPERLHVRGETSGTQVADNPEPWHGKCPREALMVSYGNHHIIALNP